MDSQPSPAGNIAVTAPTTAPGSPAKSEAQTVPVPTATAAGRSGNVSKPAVASDAQPPQPAVKTGDVTAEAGGDIDAVGGATDAIESDRVLRGTGSPVLRSGCWLDCEHLAFKEGLRLFGRNWKVSIRN